MPIKGILSRQTVGRWEGGGVQKGCNFIAERMRIGCKNTGARPVSGCQIKSRLLQIKQHRHMAGVR